MAKYREMTDAERVEWGEAERQARMRDLQDKSAAGLAKAQDNADTRRKEIGATMGQASTMVINASRLARQRA